MSGQSIGLPRIVAHRVSLLNYTGIRKLKDLETMRHSAAEDEPPPGTSPSSGPSSGPKDPEGPVGNIPVSCVLSELRGALLARAPFSGA